MSSLNLADLCQHLLMAITDPNPNNLLWGKRGESPLQEVSPEEMLDWGPAPTELCLEEPVGSPGQPPPSLGCDPLVTLIALSPARAVGQVWWLLGWLEVLRCPVNKQ